MSDILLNITLGIITSFLTVGILQFVKRNRLFKLYKGVVGTYKEVDNLLVEKFEKEIFEVNFNFNFFGNAPQLVINYYSGKKEKANWKGTYYISSPSYHELTGTFKYYKDKQIQGFDPNDFGIHHLHLFPENNCIHIAIKGIKYDYHPSPYIIMKVV